MKSLAKMSAAKVVWRYEEKRDSSPYHLKDTSKIGWTVHVYSDGMYRLQLDFERRSTSFRFKDGEWFQGPKKMSLQEERAVPADAQRLTVARREFEKHLATLILEGED